MCLKTASLGIVWNIFVIDRAGSFVSLLNKKCSTSRTRRMNVSIGRNALFSPTPASQIHSRSLILEGGLYNAQPTNDQTPIFHTREEDERKKGGRLWFASRSNAMYAFNINGETTGLFAQQSTLEQRTRAELNTQSLFLRSKGMRWKTSDFVVLLILPYEDNRHRFPSWFHFLVDDIMAIYIRDLKTSLVARFDAMLSTRFVPFYTSLSAWHPVSKPFPNHREPLFQNWDFKLIPEPNSSARSSPTVTFGARRWS